MESEWDSYLSDDPQEATQKEQWRDFRLIHESGRGWCRVFEAVFRGRRVAVKALKEEYRLSDVHRKLLRKEFEVTSIMNHPNIVAALWYDSLPDLGDCFVMEYVDGLTLADYLSEHSELNDAQIKEIITQICIATDYLHSRQTIHCDLKPSNVMLTSVGRFVKLIDLGMSRGNGFTTLELPGGTEGFTAPDAMKTGAIASQEMDIYSIGKILELMDRRGRFKSVWRRCTTLNAELRPKSGMEIPQLIERASLRRKNRRRFAWAAACLVAAVGLGIWFLDGADGANESDGTNEIKEMTLVEDSIIGVPEAVSKPAPRVIVEAPRVAEPVDTVDFRKRFAEKLENVIQSRFNDHLNLIDTMTTAQSNQRQQTGYWRWLAKGEMHEWLTRELKDNRDEINRYMREVDTEIAVFYSLDDQKTAEKQHRQAAAQRLSDLIGSPKKYAYWDGLETIIICKLDDFIWRNDTIIVPIKAGEQYLDPAGVEQRRREYMARAIRALED